MSKCTQSSLSTLAAVQCHCYYHDFRMAPLFSAVSRHYRLGLFVGNCDLVTGVWFSWIILIGMARCWSEHLFFIPSNMQAYSFVRQPLVGSSPPAAGFVQWWMSEDSQWHLPAGCFQALPHPLGWLALLCVSHSDTDTVLDCCFVVQEIRIINPVVSDFTKWTGKASPWEMALASSTGLARKLLTPLCPLPSPLSSPSMHHTLSQKG